MRRIFLSALAAVKQMAALGMTLIVKNYAARRPEDRYKIPARFRKWKRGPVPRRPSKLSMPRASLIVDRSTSFNKMRSAVNGGATPLQPDQRALARHGWYRRKLARGQAQGASS